MNILNYEQVEEIARCVEYWPRKVLAYLLRQHFAGDKTAVAFIELLYANAVYEKEVVIA